MSKQRKKMEAECYIMFLMWIEKPQTWHSFAICNCADCWSNGAHVERSCEFHTFGTCIFFYAPNRMLYSAVDFNLTAVIVKVVNDITDSNENQTIILKTWFQDYLPLKTWTFPCKYMIGVLCYGSSLIKTLRWLAGLSGLQVTQDWKRKEKRIEIFNKM